MKRWGLVVFSLLFAFSVFADIHGVKGGLVVQLGGDTAALSNHWKTGGYLFQCLETSDDKVSNARKTIKAAGVYGKVSAIRFDGKKLPYADNLVNLLIVDSRFNVSGSEMTRVLAPNGVAVMDGRRVTKPWPQEIDEWTHFLHSPDNNAVANDTRIGPPKRVQWNAGPLWLRSHETESGIPALVSAQGRIFYIFDEGPVGIVDNRLPEVWSIVARDAFNGLELWRRKLPHWGWREFRTDKGYEDLTMARARRTKFPRSFARRLVAVDDKVYTTLGYVAPLSVLDAASGKTIKTLEGTEGTDEILCGGGILLLCIRDIESEAAERRGKIIPARIAAYDTKTFKLLWEESVNKIGDLEIAMGDGKVVYASGGKYYCLNVKTGKKAWPKPSPGSGGTLVIQDGKVLNSKGSVITARSLANGEILWEDNEQKTLNPEKFRAAQAQESGKKKKKKKKKGGSGIKRGAASADLFVINGKVWRGQPKYSLDLETGKVASQANDHNLYSKGHHHRCYRGKATSRYLMSAQEGVEMLAVADDNNSQNNWTRGSCKYGVMPANGLLYIPTDQCFCEPGVKFLGFAAFAPAAQQGAGSREQGNPLEKGPAFGNLKPETGNLKSSGWSTYRGSPARSGSSKTTVATKVSKGWKTDIGGKLSQPVNAYGKVFIAAVDAHTLYALDAKTGRELWTFTAGGRIDSPPSIHNGAAIFGSADGWVYSVRATDGVLAWRFRAAPEERLVGAFEQVESAWPVHGAVLVQNGVAYCEAGRSSFVDNGIYLYALDPATGKKLNQTCVTGPQPNMDETPGQCFYQDGTRPEILVGDGKNIYMRNRQFDNSLKMAPYEFLTTKGGIKMGRHIFSTASFLDDSWYNRTFWMYSETWPDFYHANQAPKSGQLLVFDDSTTYGVKVFYHRNCHSPMFFPGTEGYLLFADDNDNEPVLRDTDDPPAIEWLPQNEYKASRGMTGLDAKAVDFDKGVGFTRAKPAKWMSWVPVRIQAMAKTNDKLFCAGQPDVFDENDPFGALQGRKGGILLTVSAKDGKTLAERKLDVAPVSDGLIASDGKLFIAMKDGSIRCYN